VVWDAASAQSLGTIRVGDPQTAELASSITDIDWSPTGTQIAIVEGGLSLSFWDAETLQLQYGSALMALINDIQYSSSGEFLAIATNSGTLLFDTENNTVFDEQETPTRVRSIAWHPISSSIAYAGEMPVEIVN